MGFSGGGSNILKPHTHNGLTVLDGGALDFNNITQSQSTAGMVFFSDGTHLQQLAYPGVPAGETLTASALSTAPSWAAAAPAPVAAYTFLDYFEQTVSGVSMDLSWSSLSFDDISSIHVLFNVEPAYDPTNIELQYSQGGSLITTSTYESRWTGLGSRTSGGTVTGDSWLIHEARDRKRVGGYVDIFGATSLVTTADRQVMGATGIVTDSAPAGSWTACDNSTQLSPQTIDGIRLSCYNTGGSASAFEPGSYIAAFSTSTS
tara:strand:+ start:336 stop:1118 length:783 start_codon:yes stop_codon:yes gene_type:complete